MTFALKSHIFKMPFHTRLLHLLGILALAVASANAAITPTQTSITGLGNGIVGLVYPPQTGTSPNPNIKFSSNNTTASENKIWRATGVPPGLTFNPSGILSGKPSKAGNFTMNLSVRVGKQVRDTGSRTIVVVDTLPPIITPSTLPGGKLDNPYQANTPNNGFKLSGTGGTPFGPNSQYPTGYYWQLIPGKLASQRLPQGMTLNPNGVISGTPVWPRPPVSSTSQTYTLQVRATDFLGKSATANFTLVIAPPQGPEILTDCPLPSGLEKYPYPVVQLKARYGKEPYRWPKPAGLPPGLVWNERGYLSGTPTTRGTYPITLQVIDANGLSANKSCEIVIRPGPELDCPSIPCARVGDALVPVKLPVIGGDLPYTYNATGLPPSITINSNTGFISGNFTGGGNFTYNATFTVRDAANRTANKTCQIVVKDRLEITTSNATALPFGIVGCSYPGKTGTPTVSINATGGWAPYTWQRILGELPPGLTINFATGAITGIPTKVGTYKFTIRVYDFCKTPKNYEEKEYTINIYCPVTVFPDPNNCLTVNKTFTSNLTASCGAAPYSWALVSSSSPAFSISVPDLNNSQVARLTGTPSQAGVVTLNYTVTSLGIAESFTVNYTVSPELKITSACPPAEVTAGKAISPLNLTASGGKGNYTWNATLTRNGTVVAPLTITNSRLNWTPPSPSTSPESYKIQFIVRDECGNVVSKECDVTIYSALTCNQTINLPCLYNGTVVPETEVFSASGGKPPYNWNFLPFTNPSKILPTGLAPKIQGNGSVISGTITESGIFSFIARVTDALGNTCNHTHTIQVHPQLEITTFCPLVVGTNGTAYSGNLTATGGKPSLSWALVPAGVGLPPGVSLNPITGQISGTPTLAGNFTFNYKVRDACGSELAKNCTISVVNTVGPTDKCFVHVSDKLIGGVFREGISSVVYDIDPEYDDIVPAGEYPDATLAFPNAATGVPGTFDGIAIGPSVRCIIYSGKNFTGSILLDIQGPAVINNETHKADSGAMSVHNELYPLHLQNIYPVSKRFWSTSDMGTWKNGSMKVICSPSQNEPKTITPETEINIWFDDSGSMSDVLPNLEIMRDEVLKPCLLPFYGGNETVYSQRVRVLNYSDAENFERTFQVLGTNGTSPGVTQVINIAFQDEANDGYHPRSGWSEEDVDIAWLRDRLQATGPDYISGAALRVEGDDDFLDLLRNVMVSGNAPYAGANNLLPYTQNGTAQLALYENIKRPGYSLGSNNTEDGSPLYYANKVVEAINDIGYNLAPCAGYQNPPISITPVILSQSPAEGATIGVPYTAILTAVGGTQPYTWSLPSGALPPGLTLDPITGIISGTPTAVGSNNFSVKVLDDNSQSDEKSFALEVNWPPLGVEWSEETPTLTAGQPANPEVFTASGGDGNYTWSVSSGSLPPGISLSGNSGKTVSLSGTPATAGTYNFIVKALSAGQEMNIDVSYIVELGPQPTPTPSPSPTPTPSDMVTVEGGTLPSGSGLAGQAISTFQIGKYEVTWGEWQSVRTWAAANGYTDLAGVGNGTAGNHPVQQVSWFDVVKWCNAKSEKEGMTPVYQVGAATYKTGQSTPTVNSASNGYRLPSEKEWEWAARGGLLSGNFTYSGSNDVNAVAWINSIEGPNEVGTKASNELGIHDMSGNVKEWCFDTSSDLWRRARGGSYDSLAFVAAVGYRDIGEFPEIRYKRELGFRLARSSAQ